MTADRLADLLGLEQRFESALVDHRGFAEMTAGAPTVDEAVGAHLRWAIWCIESLIELRVLVDIVDPRGMNESPQGFRPQPTAMGHVIWASATAMGALDRAAAAFGALHLKQLSGVRMYDFAELHKCRRSFPRDHPVRKWHDDVIGDPAYRDLLALLRHPMIHRTTPMALRARVGPSTPRDQRPAHQDAPGFYLPRIDGTLDPGYRRSVNVVEFLDEVTPSVHAHIQAAIELFESGAAFERARIPGELHEPDSGQSVSDTRI